MFWLNFKYTIKILFRNKILLFWTFIFPIILGLFFNMAFSDIESSEKFEVFDIAIVNNDDFKNNDFFVNSFNYLSENNETKIFDINYVSLDNAKKLLDEDKIVGYILFLDDDIKISVKTNGVNETIIKYVVDEIKTNYNLIDDLAKKEIEKEYQLGNYDIDYRMIYAEIGEIIDKDVKINDVSRNNLSYTMIEYYTLIAMAALYGGIIAMFITNYSLPNMSAVGKRKSLMPISKIKMLISSLCASYVVQLIGLLLLFLFTIFVLKVDYSDKFIYIILLALIGSLAGLTIGLMIASIFRTNENAKTGILVAFTMAGCFLSGMMGITMKYIIDKNFPILNIINPAAIITDGFYSLYYYDTMNRYWFNIISLILFSVIMVIISAWSLRRQKYDSI